ncbi:MAG: hypothetical protein AB7V48_00570 [Sedimentibacter sp.]
MKKMMSILFIFILTFSLAGCQKTIKGTDELIEKAREEIPVSDADTIKMKYAGVVGKDDTALIWFVSGSEYQANYYLPMECNVVGKDEYTFVCTYKPMERGEDIAVLEWKDGYCFLINNPNCSTVKITDNTGTHEIDIVKDSYPYLFYNELIPSEYIFLDADGNELS